MRKTSREAADPRVIRRHRIGRPNAMASVASDEAFLLMECIKKYANLKACVAESLFCLQWDVALQSVILHEKRWDIKIYDQLIMVMIKSASMNLVNVLVRFNQLL